MKMLDSNSTQEFPVRVAVRVRPLLQREKLHHYQSCVYVHPQVNQIVLGNSHTFTYDFVLGPKTHQDELYQTCVEPLLSNVFDGYNVTVFAYGQTGSGKTYTMTGGNIGSIPEQNFGLVPRAVKTIFDTVERRNECRVSISASYLEVYKDDIIDLLDVTDKVLDVRDDAAGNTVVIGASEHSCQSIDDVVNLLKKGSIVRHTGATQMNDESSRSHAIFTLYIEQRRRDENMSVQASYDGLVKQPQSNFDENYLSAKLHFVDLAGSERVARTQNTGERFQESIRINSGLLALGNVVYALSDPRRRSGHIPYRDAKITRLLKDSLGGNAKTLMICCVSPCAVDLDESLNALRYADRARHIRNKPIKNVDPNAQRFIEMQSEIQFLKQELERQRTMMMVDNHGEENGSSSTGRYSKQNLSTPGPESDNLRRLIQTAYVCFQQLYECNYLNDDQKRLIQNWLNALSNDNSDLQQDFNDDPLTHRIGALEEALQAAQDELRSESQVRVKREGILNRLQEQLKLREDELNRMRSALDESNHHRKQQQEIVSQLEVKLTNGSKDQQTRRTTDVLNIDGSNATFFDRTKSAPHFGGAYKKDTSIQPRTIHSSPATFDMEYVVERFHGRSIALAHSQEEVEELDLRDDKQQKDGKFIRRGTYRVRKSRNTPSILDHAFQDDPLQSLTQASITKQKLIEESNRKVKEAESKIQDLSINIQLKEQLIKSVFASNKDVKDTNEQYEQHIKLLEKEVERAKQEYNDLQKTVQQIAAKGTTEKSKLENEYRKKCDMAKARLESLQQKEKQYRELMSKLNGNSEKRIADLQAALFRMKQQHETAQKRVKEETDLKNKIEQELIREQQRIQELTIQNEQQQKILKLKTEGLVAAQRKLRTAQGTGIGIGDQQQTTTSNFDHEMEKLVYERKELNTLKEELEKREDLIRKKETLLSERTELETKKVRTSQVLNKSLKSVNEKLENVDKQIRQSANLRDKEKQSNHLLMKEQLLKQKRLFNERLEQNNVLTPSEERRLIEINEAIEAVDLAVDYQNNIINRKEKEVQQSMRASQGPESPLFKISQLSESESKELCRKLLEKVIDLKDNDQKNQREFVDVKSQLDEQNQVIFELKSRINQETIEYDRKLTCIQQTNEEEKHLLLKQLTDTTAQIKDLEKDLYFYKHKTRELRKSMATSTNTIQDSINTSTRQQISQNVATVSHRRGSSVNDDLPTQLQTPRTAVQQYQQQQQQAPFLIKIGNRSNSSQQLNNHEQQITEISTKKR